MHCIIAILVICLEQDANDLHMISSTWCHGHPHHLLLH